MTQIRLISLSELLDNMPGKDDAQLVYRAYQLAEDAHNGRLRSEGSSYIEHAMGVAQIILDLAMDRSTLVAGLLHEILLPHTNITEADVLKQFGADVVSLVTSLNNLNDYTAAQKKRLNPKNSEDAQLEVVRNALLSIIEGDIRVIIIRLADCLQELREASSLDAKSRRVLAREALHIFAPLANRLGIWRMKWELEDLAFRYLEPRKYKRIASKLAERRTERTQKVTVAAAQLRAKIKENGFQAEVSGRSKHIYSIYRKMQRKRLNFEEIFDIQALRVILDPTDIEAYNEKSIKEKEDEDRALCYQVLALIHGLWTPISKEFDDYISSPKANGYQSLHTAVIDHATGQTLEVQIRTRRMHLEAERGVAAHWSYKEGGLRLSSSAERRIQSFRDQMALLRNPETDGSEILADRIYVFTPKGDVVDLPVGATPIDFAYQIHTSVGHRTRGAKVNGKMVSLDYELKSGSRVEIITSKKENPSRNWMNASLGYTASARTRSKIRQWFRQQERDQNIQQGRELVERELRRLNLADSFTIEDIAKALKFDDVTEFLARVGFGDIQSAQISGAIAIMERDLQPDDKELLPLLRPRTKPKGLVVRGVRGLHTRMAGCCTPVAPEEIIGYITRGSGVTIHRQDCKEARLLMEAEGLERFIEVDWGTEAETHPIPIVIESYRRSGLIDEMVQILRGRGITVPRTKTVLAKDGTICIYLVAELANMEQLNWLLQKFENIPTVISARRQRWK